ncbi:MAG: lysine--tRNA ligase [Deltaproteobacteria bacterium]|nr:lysine--tRNA ligase [Deltaproteobacteria bacterium]
MATHDEGPAAGGIEEIVRVRREKAAKMAEQGWPSFPSGLVVTHTAAEVRAAPGEVPSEPTPDAARFRVAGRVMADRSAFIDLWDRTGKIQVQVKKGVLDAATMANRALLDLGDFVWVEGPRFVTRAGELTLRAEKMQLAAKSLHPLPDTYFGVSDIELRYRERYVDLLANRGVRDVFEKRSRLVRFLRSFLDQRGFVEVETPMLHTLVSGAAAKPFTTHHNALDMDMFLRIAPELFLKRLVVGGLERVYEINRNFRNEGLSTQHNPEFTMLEFYQAYATYENLMDLTEEMFRGAAQAIAGTLQIPHGGWKEGETPTVLDFERPFRRIRVREGIAEKLPGINLGDRAALLQAAEARHLSIDPKGSLGKVQMDLFEGLWADELMQPTFVIDFPIEVSPLSRRKDSDPTLADRFELYVTGKELANAFSELNDPDDQRARFQAQVKAKAQGDEEAMDYDEDYCHALEVGMPPTAGEGVGIDRLAMVLTNQPSIRDVILFPAMRRLEAKG